MNLAAYSVDTIPASIIPHITFDREGGIRLIRPRLNEADAECEGESSERRAGSGSKVKVKVRQAGKPKSLGFGLGLGDREGVEGDQEQERARDNEPGPSRRLPIIQTDTASRRKKAQAPAQAQSQNHPTKPTKGAPTSSSTAPQPPSSSRPPNQTFILTSEKGGYSIWSTSPLSLLRRVFLPGTLQAVYPLPFSPLLVIQGGGRNPLYPPNKLVFFNDVEGKEVLEVEFEERVRGVEVRLGSVVVILGRSVVWFEYGMKELQDDEGDHVVYQDQDQGQDQAKLEEIKRNRSMSASSTTDLLDGSFVPHLPNRTLHPREKFWIEKRGEWQTFNNPRGLAALSTETGSTLLAIPGRQSGHLQLVQLDPCPAIAIDIEELDDRDGSAPSHNPSRLRSVRPRTSSPQHAPKSPIIIAHEHDLASIAISTCGKYLATASEKGTIIRIWETSTGSAMRELRRGMENVEILGMCFTSSRWRGGEATVQAVKTKLACWSDKGSIHVWEDVFGSSTSNQASNRVDHKDKGTRAAPSSSSSTRSTTSKLKSMINPLLVTAANSASQYVPFQTSLSAYFQAKPSSAQYYLPRDSKFNRTPMGMPTWVGLTTESDPGFAEMQAPQPTPKELKIAERYTVGWIYSDHLGVDTEDGRPQKRDASTDWPEWQQTFADSISSGTDNQNQNQSPNVTPTPEALTQSGKHQLVILTNSGEYFRLSLPNPKEGTSGPLSEEEEFPSSDTESGTLKDSSPASPATDVGQDGRDHNRRRYRNRCKVEEYRKFDTVISGW